MALQVPDQVRPTDVAKAKAALLEFGEAAHADWQAAMPTVHKYAKWLSIAAAGAGIARIVLGPRRSKRGAQQPLGDHGAARSPLSHTLLISALRMLLPMALSYFAQRRARAQAQAEEAASAASQPAAI